MIAIKKLRERKGLTQMQMADALGVARQNCYVGNRKIVSARRDAACNR